MSDLLARNWGWIALRGVAAIVFGTLTFLNPGISLAALVLVFGAYAFADGILMVISGLANRRNQPMWGVIVLGGIASLVIGILTFLWPGITAVVLLLFIAAWAIVIGIAEIIAAIRLRKLISGEWILVLVGVLAVLFGILVAAFPGAGALAMVLWIGTYALVAGILLLALAWRLRRWQRTRQTGTIDPKSA